MKVTKEEILEVAKNSGFNEEEAEKLLELFAKKSGKFIVGAIQLIAKKSENDLIISAVDYLDDKVIEMIDNIEVNL